MSIIYNCLLYILLPFLPLRLWWRGRKNPAYRLRWRERFACYKDIPVLNESIWVHAVSLGEAVAATPLVQALKQKYPNTPIVFTTMTPTGMAHIQKALGGEVIALYVPYDYPYAIKKFLNHIKPKFLMIMETELWPNILHYCNERDIPVFLANARLTAHSFKGYNNFFMRTLTKNMLHCINTIFAQSKKDADYFLQLGAEPQNVHVMGNIKFDITLPKDMAARGEKLRLQWEAGGRRQIWIAASTHPGEEEIVLTAHTKILQQLPEALLILVPRHIERTADITALCQQHGLQAIRYSTNESCLPATNVILGDVVGQLLLFYAASDIAFVGGSIVAGIGGHNVLEPAALALPILVGPYTETLADVRALLEDAQSLVNVNNENELAEQVLHLLQNPTARQQLGKSAHDTIEQNRGIIDRILGAIAE